MDIHKYGNLLCDKSGKKVSLEKIDYSIYDVKVSEQPSEKKWNPASHITLKLTLDVQAFKYNLLK